MPPQRGLEIEWGWISTKISLLAELKNYVGQPMVDFGHCLLRLDAAR